MKLALSSHISIIFMVARFTAKTILFYRLYFKAQLLLEILPQDAAEAQIDIFLCRFFSVCLTKTSEGQNSVANAKGWSSGCCSTTDFSSASQVYSVGQHLVTMVNYCHHNHSSLFIITQYCISLFPAVIEHKALRVYKVHTARVR